MSETTTSIIALSVWMKCLFVTGQLELSAKFLDPAFNPGSATYQLRDLGAIINLSQPQLAHL